MKLKPIEIILFLIGLFDMIGIGVFAGMACHIFS